ncbi:MAG: DUF1553 domain-containing protein [Planctomycetaceae bacterium]|nr:DUF1553 domain-containing protein [Planctomycetaceae bacterium]
MSRLDLFIPLGILSLLCCGSGELVAADDPRGIQFFEAKIRPVLIQHCYECHAADSKELGGDLRVDLRAGLLQGGESGPAVVPGKPEESLLISSLEYRDFEMPPAGKLDESIIRDFRRWVRMGAPDPRGGEMTLATQDVEPTDAKALWSLQPIEQPVVPEVDDARWSTTEVDRFLQAARVEHGLQTASAASPTALLRRVSFDLTGLPPSPEQVHAFVENPSPAAYANYVDTLLASPQFGERWGRHWLDVVRYGESAGSSRDVLMLYAWRYRDYVIDAFNADVPYDRFLAEQLAGDLLPADGPAERDRLQVATGLLAIGSKSLNGGNVELDLVDDQLDVIGKAMLGLTISCARCHDHKFDPIPTADYYALAGIFRSTDTYYGGSTNRPKNLNDQLKVYLPLGPDAEQTVRRARELTRQSSSVTKELTALTKELKTLQKKLPKDWEQTRDRLTAAGNASTDNSESSDSGEAKPALTEQQSKTLATIQEYEAKLAREQELQAEAKEVREAETQLPALEFAHGTREASKIGDSPIHIRGERTKTGDVVPRGYLSCVSCVAEVPQIREESSGRLELSQWLTRPDHPLTSRVAVNRIWQHLFGRGLVDTVDNFGTNGTAPTHPELLDWLARRYVEEHGWSTKAMIRELVLTQSYQLGADYIADSAERDPGNEYYWKMSRRRLEAEALRDAMLAASGRLELSRPHGSPVLQVGEGEVGRGINTKPLEQPYPYRSVYLPIIRGLLPEMLRVFDFPEPSNPQGLRDATNVPAQSLYLMNSPFVIEQSEALARLIVEASDEDAERIELAWLRVLGRSPRPDEVTRVMAYLSQSEAELSTTKSRALMSWSSVCQALFAGAEFRYLE